MNGIKSICFVLVGMSISVLGCDNQREPDTLNFVNVSSRGYSQAVEFSSGNTTMLFISGQVPVDSLGKTVGINNLEKQTTQVFENIKSLVEKSGGTMSDVVNIECYFTDISKISEFRSARDRYINLEKPPASTAIQVERLINEDFMIEINAVAIIY